MEELRKANSSVVWVGEDYQDLILHCIALILIRLLVKQDNVLSRESDILT